MKHIILGKKTYEDKVRACWLGKNIGGTMGAPFEGKREILDVKGYTTKPGTPLPNDDLDLQLAWLHCLEMRGPNEINAKTLGELWLNFIVPHWNEYGICKANMQRGLVPPLAGDYNSTWSHSNGAWIRTEVWACTAPALPEVAAKYAIEDAKVDHGCGEGTHAAAFVAALQSAAFVLDDLYDCIDVAMATIPESSRVGQSIKLVIDCYRSGKSWVEARNAVLEANKDIGDGWFEAPSNVAYTVLGLVYGEGDFKKSMLTAINCGDDTDCTAATVGATLGILGGTAAIPADWREYIGDDIITISINRGSAGRSFPKTCTELSNRIIDVAPSVVQAHRCYAHWDTWLYRVNFATEADIDPADAKEQMIEGVGRVIRRKLEGLKPYTIEEDNGHLYATLSLSSVDIKPGEQISIAATLRVSKLCDNAPFTFNARWLTPDGFTVEGPTSFFIPNPSRHTEVTAEGTYTVKLDASAKREPTSRLVLELTGVGRHTALYVPVVLVG